MGEVLYRGQNWIGECLRDKKNNTHQEVARDKMGMVRTYDIIRSKTLSGGDPFLFVRWYDSEEEPPCSWTEGGRLVR